MILTNKQQAINILFDIFLIASLLIFPSLTKFFVHLSMMDEIVVLLMGAIVLINMTLSIYKFSKFEYIAFILLFYSVFLILFNHLPMRNLLQIFIYFKFIIIYLYFNRYNSEYKSKLFSTLIKIFILIYITSLIFTCLQFTFPSTFHGYSLEGRGFGGITAQGIFGSRTVYPEFLILFTILLFSIKKIYRNIFNSIIEMKYYLATFTLGLIILTFARKELLLFLALIPILIFDKIEQKSKPIFYILLTLSLFIIFSFLMFIVFKDMNSTTFVDRQVRLYILNYAIEIFNAYFPFGSGPGTYGSIMSLQYLDVYEQFNVGENVLGFNGHRGPIFDVFLFGLLAEYGLGIIFFFMLIWKMLVRKNNTVIENYFNIKKYKIAFFIVMFSTSFFVPMLLNWVGWMYIIFLALVTNKGDKEYE